MAYLWLKTAHLAFMVTWFAGLFYLPRLFIYHAEASDALSRDRFIVMERRLFAIMTIGAVLTIGFGLWLLTVSAAATQGWLHVKLLLVLGLVGFHASCLVWMRKLKSGYQSENTKSLRWYNEIPVFFLLTIIALAVLKPF